MNIKAIRGALRLGCLLLVLLLTACSESPTSKKILASGEKILDSGGNLLESAVDSIPKKSEGTEDTDKSDANNVKTDTSSTNNAGGGGGYIAPQLETSGFSDAGAVTENGVSLDLSGISKGYVAVKATNASRMKFIIRMGKQEYTYDLPNNGTVVVYPLQSGNGTYTFHGFQNTSGKSYLEILTKSAEVTLESEFTPFLRPNQQVDYNANSKCVAKANELAKTASNEAEVVAAVYKYVQKNIKYDYDFAKNAPKGYISNPDATLASQKGICGDYSALVAAMLRSQGIPTKVVTGYVSPDDLYHAWNMVYLKEVGWITKEIKAPANKWQRIDLTFAANGSDANFIGDGSNYVDRYIY